MINSKAVKSVQYGTVTIPTNASSSGVATATVSAVNVNKSILIHLGSTSTGSTNTPGCWDTRLSLLSSTQVQATRNSVSGITDTAIVSFCLVEFY